MINKQAKEVIPTEEEVDSLKNWSRGIALVGLIFGVAFFRTWFVTSPKWEQYVYGPLACGLMMTALEYTKDWKRAKKKLENANKNPTDQKAQGIWG